MLKGPEYPKVSFLVPRPMLAKVNAFATRQNMGLSEAMRFIIDLGLETLSTVENIKQIEDRAALLPQPKGDGATRGKFPRPTGGPNGSAS